MTTPTSGGETTVPLMPCRSLDELLPFYGALGFETTFEQRDPYVYASVRRGAVELHFSDFGGMSQRNGVAACLVMVSDIAPYHRAFSDALRAAHGRVPTAGLPRISRLREGLDRFGLFDPSGNWLIFLQPPQEGDGAWEQGEGDASPLLTAIDMAALFRDFKGNDDAKAAKILDVALARDSGTGSPLHRALALAARAEIAVAQGDRERAAEAAAERDGLPLSDEERETHRKQLQAAGELERWIAQG